MLLSIVFATSEPNRILPTLIFLGIIVFAVSIWLAIWANRRVSFTFDTGTIPGRTLSWALRITLSMGVFCVVVASAAASFTLLAVIL
jgi:DNA-binding transcriptional regulator of glucitol operon